MHVLGELGHAIRFVDIHVSIAIRGCRSSHGSWLHRGSGGEKPQCIVLLFLGFFSGELFSTVPVICILFLRQRDYINMHTCNSTRIHVRGAFASPCPDTRGGNGSCMYSRLLSRPSWIRSSLCILCTRVTPLRSRSTVQTRRECT